MPPITTRASAETRRDLTCRTFTLRADSINEEERSFEAVVASEKRTLVFDMSCWRIIEEILLMSGCRIPKQTPLLDTHDRSTISKQLGSARDWKISGSQCIAKNFISAAEEGAWTKVREKHVTDCSIGYRVHKAQEIPRGATAIVEGKQYKAGNEYALRISTDWEPRENSLCPIGADGSAKIRQYQGAGALALPSATHKEKRMNEFEKWVTERGHKMEELDEAKRAELLDEFLKERDAAQRASIETVIRAEIGAVRAAATDTVPADKPIDVEKAISAAVVTALAARDKDTADRTAAVREICGGEYPDIERQAIVEGWDALRTNSEVLKAVRNAVDSGIGVPAIRTGTAATTRQNIEDALRINSAQFDSGELEAELGDQRMQAATDLSREISLLDICRQALRMDEETIPKGRDEIIRAAFSTFSMPQILGNVANKALLRGYMYASQTWRNWCTIGSVKDFKEVTRARMTDMGDLEEVTGSGEIKHGTGAEEYEKYSVTTYAKQFTVTRQDIINDDLSVFTRVPKNLGLKAANRISKLVYTHLLANGNMSDGIALFHASHSNLITGSAYALSAGAASLREGLKTFRQQTDKDGEPLDVTPALVLATPEDEEYIRALLRSITLAEGSTAGLPVANIWGSMGLKPVIETRLSNLNYSGYSETAWYLNGSPNEVDTVEVAFLDGRQVPTVTRFSQNEMGINVLGVGFQVYIDAGVKALDWRGMVKVTGATA